MTRGARNAGNLLLLPLTLWMAAAFAVPLAIVLLLSVQNETSPFAPLSLVPSLTQFTQLLGDGYYLRVFATSLRIGIFVTLASLIIGLPIAAWLARLPSRWRPFGLSLVLIPLLTNVIIRSVGLILLLAPNGPFERITGLRLLFTESAVVLSLTQVFAPFLIMAVYDSLQARDPRIDEAALSLGASPAARFLTVTLPLALPALRAGASIVFLLATTAFVSAVLIGGKKVWVVGMLIYDEGLINQNAPIAAALAVLLLLLSLAGVALIGMAVARVTPWLDPGRRAVPRVDAGLILPMPLLRVLDRLGRPLAAVVLGVGLVLLVFPLAMVLINSVNDVPQATTAAWRGLTGKWYARAFSSSYVDTAKTSAQLALASIACAVAIALPAAFALVRYRARTHGPLVAFFMAPWRCRASPSASACCGCCRSSWRCRPSSGCWPFMSCLSCPSRWPCCARLCRTSMRRWRMPPARSAPTVRAALPPSSCQVSPQASSPPRSSPS